MRTLLSKGHSKDEVVNVFRFIDKMIQLPDELQAEFNTDVIRYQEEGKMPFISRLEEMAQEKGRKKGILESRLLTLREDILAIIEIFW